MNELTQFADAWLPKVAEKRVTSTHREATRKVVERNPNINKKAVPGDAAKVHAHNVDDNVAKSKVRCIAALEALDEPYRQKTVHDWAFGSIPTALNESRGAIRHRATGGVQISAAAGAPRWTLCNRCTPCSTLRTARMPRLPEPSRHT